MALLPGLGGSGYTNSQPINFGAVSVTPPKTVTQTQTKPVINQNLATQYPGIAGSVQSMGVTASNPMQNIQPPKTTIPTSQAQPTYTPAGGAVTMPSNNGVMGQAISQAPQPIMAENTSGGATGYQQPPLTYPGLVGSLAQNSIIGSPIASQAAQGLIGTAQNNPLTSGPAYDNYNKAVQNLQNLQSQIAQQYSGVETSGIPLGYQQGREQVMARQYASQIDAAQQAVNQAQAALGYGIQEQGQQQAGYNQAGNLGIAGQGQLQSGLTSAVGAAQPSGSYPFVFNPLTGSYSQSGSGSGVVTPQQAAQAVLSGQMTYDQANQALGYMGGSGTAQLQSSILAANPNANITQLQAQGAGQSTVLAQLPQMNAALSAANGIQDQITGFLNQNPDINQNTAAVANAAQQWLQNKQLTDPRYQSFFNMLSEYANTIAPVLGVGGSPTDMKTQIAQSFINAQAKGSSIVTVLNNLANLADTKVKNIKAGASGNVTQPQIQYTGGSSSSAIHTPYGTIDPTL